MLLRDAYRCPLSLRLLGCVGVTGAVAALLWPLATTDLAEYLLPWYAHIRAAGPIDAFAAPFSNYTPPYLYLLTLIVPLGALVGPASAIKLLSFVGLGLLALSVERLLRRIDVTAAGRAALVLVTPTLLVNPALLVQCDAFWAAASVMAVTAAIDRRPAAMFGWFGLAVAFKAQALFLAPFFVAFALARTTSWRRWIAAPAAFAAVMLPAWLAGWPAGDLATIYLRQERWFSALSLNAPNLWSILQAFPALAGLPLGGIGSATAVAASGLFIAHFRWRLRDADAVATLRAAALAAMIAPELLPRMHERFFFMADVLTLALALARPVEWRPALLTQLGSGLAILAYLSGVSGLAIAGAVAMLAATWTLCRPARCAFG